MSERRAHALCSIVLLAVVLLPCASPAFAQSSAYDGRWVANVPQQGRCPASRLTLDVRGQSIAGFAVNPSGAFPVVGSIGPQGPGVINIVQMGGTIRFGRDRFEARYFNVCGPRRAIGTRLRAPPHERRA